MVANSRDSQGRNYGIEKGAGVVFAGGVVGKVIGVCFHQPGD